MDGMITRHDHARCGCGSLRSARMAADRAYNALMGRTFAEMSFLCDAANAIIADAKIRDYLCRTKLIQAT
jgi:hypothetical protein